MPRRGRSAQCCERQTELTQERGRAAVSGVSLLADTDCFLGGAVGAAGHLPPPLTYMCLDPI